jgi:methyl-accepting chemotaxis protein
VGQVLEVAVPILFGVAGTAFVGMDSGLISGELSTITGRLVIQFAIASVAGIILLHLVITFILRHMTTIFQVLERVGRGDLTVRASISTRDEFRVLADHLNDTFEQLGGMITRVRQSYDRISRANERIVTVYHNVLEGIDQESGLASEAMDSVQDNKRMIDEVTQGIHVLESSANDSFSSIMEMGASIEEVSAMSESLFTSVTDSNTAIESLSGSIDQITENLVSLTRASDETASAMSEMSASIVQVRGNAETTSQDAIKMTKVAEDGTMVSRDSMEGILAIRESSGQVGRLISTVTERIEEIDEILSFITDITGKTNLLALNAAIIAAQAGAQGKGFGVVADEINELAQSTKAQTNRIAQVIEGLRTEVAGTSEAMEVANTSVEKGVKLAEGVTSALEGIMDSTMQVSHRVEEIAQTTAEQANTSNRVMNVAEQLTESVTNIKQVSEAQSESGDKLLDMSKLVQQAAERVKTSTEEQTVTSQQINKDLTRISDTVRSISESTEMQAVNGTRVLKMTEDLTGVINSNREAVQGLQDILTDLDERMGALRDELAVLKVGE